MRITHRAILTILGTPLDVVCMIRAFVPLAHHSWIPDANGNALRAVTSEEATRAAVDDGLALASAIRAKVREKMAAREKVRRAHENMSPEWKAAYQRAREMDEAEARRRNEKASA